MKMRAYVIAIVSVIALGATASPASAEGLRGKIYGVLDRVQGADQDDNGIINSVASAPRRTVTSISLFERRG